VDIPYMGDITGDSMKVPSRPTEASESRPALARKRLASNNMLVSEPLPAEFFRRFIRRYDRDHADYL
jgi:hypothetical protein